MNTRKKAIAGLAAVAVGGILGIGGFAIAAFTETVTSNPANGSAANMVPLTVSGETSVYDTGTTGLWPNHPADVKFTVTNTNEVPVKVTSIALNTATSGSQACTPELVITNPANPSPALSAAAATIQPNQSQEFVLIDAVSLPGNASNACQGIGFTTTWTVLGENV